MAGEELTEASFIADHGRDALVKMGNGDPMPLGEVLDWEAAICTAPEDLRNDPERRLRQLAKSAHAAGSLLPKYARLVEPAE